MKTILFINPSSYDDNNNLLKSRKAFIPPRTLPYLAALSAIHHKYEMKIIDEIVEDVPFEMDAALVILTGMITHIDRAIDIAGKFRAKGAKVIIGGPGAYSCMDYVQKSNAFDSIVSGEADELWKSIIEDFDQNRLKPSYKSVSTPLLSNLPFARFDLINKKKYRKSSDKNNPMLPIETSRGCPYNCKFCMVTNYFGKKIRHRPISDVVAEIRHHNAKDIVFTDDNIIADTDYSIELFKALKPLGVEWFGQFDTTICQKPELVKLANECGCGVAFLGIESTDQNNLLGINKRHNMKNSLKDISDAFKHTKISVHASMIFGMDFDTEASMAETINELVKNNIDALIPWILTPMPGTAVYDEMKAQGRILHENYSLYDGTHVVFQPKQMTPQQLSDAYWKIFRQFYKPKPVLKRLFGYQKGWLFEQFIYDLYVAGLVRQRIHPWKGKLYAEHNSMAKGFSRYSGLVQPT